jgi:uncharacterized membrane protein YidH (DUF202 family)
MELRDGLILERYRLAIDRQRYFTGVARDAFATYAKFAAGLGAVAVTLVSARESLGLDKAVIPDAIAVLACVLVFLAVAAIIQIVVAMVRWRRFRQHQAEIDSDAPPVHSLWWFAEAAYLLVITASLALGWRILETLARTASTS